MVANLTLADAPSEVYSVQLGGFDTHAYQLLTQEDLLSDLDSPSTSSLDALSTTNRGQEDEKMSQTDPRIGLLLGFRGPGDDL